MNTLVVVATIKAKNGKEAALREVLRSLIAPTLVEQGCMRYELNEAEDGKSWIFTEQWQSKTLWEQHMASPQLDRFKTISEEMVAHFELFTGALVSEY